MSEESELLKNAKYIGTLREVWGEEKIKEFNKKMDKVNRDYIRKARQSEIDASKVILTDQNTNLNNRDNEK